MPQITYSDPQISITLATLCYLDYGKFDQMHADLANTLARPELPPQNEWSLDWGPYHQGKNLSFVVKGPNNKYIYAVRGTEFTAWHDLIEDVDVTLTDLPWNDSSLSGAKIAQGAVDGWKDLTQMGSTQIWDYIHSLPANSELIVTGHSLGAMLASVMGLYFWSKAKSTSQSLTVTMYSFAGETAGNHDFATAVQSYLGGTRYHNSLDVIPHAYAHDDLVDIKTIYPGNLAPDEVEKLLLDRVIDCVGDRYVQPNLGNGELTHSRLYLESGWFKFIDEMLAQHKTYLYMWLLGIPLNVIKLMPGSSDWSPPATS